MNKKPTILIRSLDITVRAKNVLTAMGIHTIDDLYSMYVLETIPKIGTNVHHYPYIARTIDLVYTKKVNEEVKDLLKQYCEVTELDKVGV